MNAIQLLTLAAWAVLAAQPLSNPVVVDATRYCVMFGRSCTTTGNNSIGIGRNCTVVTSS